MKKVELFSAYVSPELTLEVVELPSELVQLDQWFPNYGELPGEQWKPASGAVESWLKTSCPNGELQPIAL